MKKIFKITVAFLLVIGTLMTSSFSAFAKEEEEYLCELRLIYAEDYREAQDILDDSEFYEYELYKKNLNAGTGEIGVFLAYKTTTNIEDAITDITAIEMDGGYRDGCYQEALKQSYDEYVALGENYVVAIKYLMKAYEANSFPAKAAFRQLNFYTVIDNEVSFNGRRLGDIFKAGITPHELATMFLEGNTYALDNVRSLISMGVTYNADGKTYFEKVSEEAARYGENPNCYDAILGDFQDAVVHVKAAVKTFHDMFKELSTCENQLNYEDNTLTAQEIQYSEYKAIADMTRKVDYLDGKTLYDFCLSEGGDLKVAKERLYPLIAALNEGQRAMTLVGHYYDVVRYSMKDFPEEMMNEQIDSIEEIYSEAPFDIYTGVDRSIYDGNFALTREAYRANAYTEEGLAAYLFNKDNALMTSLAIGGGAIGVGLSVWAIIRTGQLFDLAASLEPVREAAINAANSIYSSAYDLADEIVGMKEVVINGWDQGYTYNELMSNMMLDYYPHISDPASLPLLTKMSYLEMKVDSTMTLEDSALYNYTAKQLNAARENIEAGAQCDLQNAKDISVYTMNKLGTIATGALYVIGGALMLYSAITLALTIYDYYHPEYSAIPVAIVDLVDTEDGDRYIKYDVVYEVSANSGENYAPADLNAFEGQRWNALYYTKSYEAGKPLLAEFDLSNSNNVPDVGYAPVRRFGEVVCYDLNKYNYEADSDNIYLSVLQSKNQKSAVADVPQLIGSIFANGWIFVAGGIGLGAGIGMTLGIQAIGKRKKSSESKKNAE